jgi:uncharacterized protein (TIGR00251 family)
MHRTWDRFQFKSGLSASWAGPMKIRVVVKPNARVEKVIMLPDGSYAVHVHAPAIEGRANERLVEVLASHFNKRKSGVAVVAGHRGKHKIVEIGE